MVLIGMFVASPTPSTPPADQPAPMEAKQAPSDEGLSAEQMKNLTIAAQNGNAQAAEMLAMQYMGQSLKSKQDWGRVIFWTKRAVDGGNYQAVESLQVWRNIAEKVPPYDQSPYSDDERRQMLNALQGP